MLISIIAFGSRGDVQPCVALAGGLIDRGHRVRLIGPAELAALVAGTSIDYRPIDLNQKAQIEAYVAAGGGFLKTFGMQRRNLRDHAVQAMRQVMQETEGAELLLSTALTISLAADLAEHWGIPLVHSLPFPAFPTRAFPTPLILPIPRVSPGWINLLGHYLTWTAIWFLTAGPINAARATVLGLPPRRHRDFMALLKTPSIPVLMSYSRELTPEAPDWPSHIVTTGFWRLPAPSIWRPQDALVTFIAEGSPPIYVGFGSMTFANSEAVADMIVGAAAATRRRVIMSSGWGGLRPTLVSKDVFLVDDIPHDWLFPQMAAIVHHGGAGTTAAALSAGVPSIVTPFTADQPFWAWRLQELGVAPRPIPFSNLTTAALANAVNGVLSDKAMRDRAAALGVKIADERGVANAVAVIESAAVRHASLL